MGSYNITYYVSYQIASGIVSRTGIRLDRLQKQGV
jgi:hypothetical protein